VGYWRQNGETFIVTVKIRLHCPERRRPACKHSGLKVALIGGAAFGNKQSGQLMPLRGLLHARSFASKVDPVTDAIAPVFSTHSVSSWSMAAQLASDTPHRAAPLGDRDASRNHLQRL